MKQIISQKFTLHTTTEKSVVFLFKYNPAVILQQSEFFVIYNFILDYIIANGHTGTSVVSGKAAKQTSVAD